jgi:hypothetical protein
LRAQQVALFAEGADGFAQLFYFALVFFAADGFALDLELADAALEFVRLRRDPFE